MGTERSAWYGEDVIIGIDDPGADVGLGVGKMNETHPARRLQPAFLLVWASSLVLIAGLVYVYPMTSARLLVLAAAGAVGIWMTWSHPELGLVTLSFLTASFIPRDQVVVTLAGLRIDPADIVMLGLLAFLVLQGLRRGTMIIPRWSFIGPLVVFAGVAAFSALYAVLYQRVQVGLVLGELRPALYCAGSAIAAAMIVRRQQLTILLVGLFIVADLTAGAGILLQFAGPRAALLPVLAPGVWQIDQMGGSGGGLGTVRVVPPAHVLMYLMANVAFCLLLRPPKVPWLRVLLALQLAFLGLGLLLTYTRAQWIASMIALLLVYALLPWGMKKSLVRFLVVALPILAVVVWLGGTELIPQGGSNAGQALISRFTSLLSPEDTLDSASLEWRVFEIDAATKSVSEHPLLGVGVGNDYRDVTLLQGEASGWLWPLGGPSRLTRWVHNSYLYIAAKMGLIAIGVFIWFGLAFLVVGLRTYASLPDGTGRLVVLAVVCSFAGLLEWAVFEAHLMLPAGMTTLGLAVGTVAGVSSRGPMFEGRGS